MNTLPSIINTECHFFTIAELTDSLRELVVSAGSLTEAESMAQELDYQYFLVEPYDLDLPQVEEPIRQGALSDMPHTLQVQAI
jgi:DNA phosphorothioation-dependent restriction protein DptG